MSKNLDTAEVKALLSALDDLIDMKIFFRKIVPDYILDEDSYEKFLSILESLYLKIYPLFTKYLPQNLKIFDKQEKEFLNQIKEDKSYILVSANSSKKILKSLGIDPQNIIVSGGPLIFEDYKKVNPQLSNEVLSGIKRKCDNILELLHSNKLKSKSLFFIFETQNLTDNIIIKELNTNMDLIGKKVQFYGIRSWKSFEKQSQI